MTKTQSMPASHAARVSAPSVPIKQPSTGQDRGAATARLLDELHHTDDERKQAVLRDEVVVLNMGVARTIAHRYRQRGLAEDDLVQAAYVGWVKAVNLDLSGGRGTSG